MATTSGQVILQLREALGMTRTEFARALDWSPATISRWERGKAEPSRLDFKTILAFAEERKVRYRPKPAPSTLPALRWSPPNLTIPEPRARFLSVGAERPGWRAEATFRVSTTPRPRGVGSRLGAGLASLGIGAATLCALLLLGIPGGRRQPVSPSAVRHPPVADYAQAVVVPAEPVEPPPAPVSVQAAQGPEPPAVPLARLDAIVVIGQTRRATFSVDEQSVTIDQGGRLGPERVTAISGDRVELVSDAGETHVVQLGDETALD